jgi:hypothetical protein
VTHLPGVLALAGCLVLAACGGDPGDEAARAACTAYGDATSGAAGAETGAVLDTAQERAQRAAEANDSYAALQRDLDDALARARVWADAQSAGEQVSAAEVDAYFAADEQVRADCADAGSELGPLRP